MTFKLTLDSVSRQLLSRIAVALERLVRLNTPAPPPLAAKLTLRFGSPIPIPKGEAKMPLNLPDDDEAPYFIVGQNAKKAWGASLGSGQTITVVSADPATVGVTPDATPQPTPSELKMPDGTTIPAGTPTVASGMVSSAAVPASPNQAITITATVNNADGSAAESISDTVSVVPGAAVAIGELFGAVTPVGASGSLPAAPAPAGPSGAPKA